MDGWVGVQERAFLSWANNHLKEGGFEPVTDLTEGFKDGVNLHNLLVCLTKRKFKRKITTRPRHNAQQLDNLKTCFNFMQDEKINFINIGCADIHAGSKKLTLALLWNLILHYEICKFTEDGDKAKAKADLLLWVQNRCEEKGVTVSNFTKDFKDGKALAALCESIQPTKVEGGSIEKGGISIETVSLNDAVEMSANVLGFPSLLDAPDIGADEQAMMMFLAQFYQRFGTKEEVEHNRKTEQDANRIDTTRSKIEGDDLLNPQRFKVNRFFVTPCDENGEAVNCKLRQISASLTSASGQSIPIQLSRCEDGRFEASFVPVELGPHMLDVQLKESHVEGCPMLIHVRDDGPDASRCVAYGAGLSGARVSAKTGFTIETRGSAGEIVDVTSDRVNVRIVSSDGIDLPDITLEKTGNGTFKASYLPKLVGPIQVYVEVDGKLIRDSPFLVEVSGQEAAASNCCAFGPGLEGGSPNEKLTFFVEGQDEQGLPIKIPEEKLSVFVCGPAGMVACDIVPTDKGYSVSYVPPVEGDFFVDVKVGGVSVQNCPKTVRVKKPVSPVSHSSSTVNGVGDCELGKVRDLTICMKNEEGGVAQEMSLDRVQVVLTNSDKKVEEVQLREGGNEGEIIASFVPSKIGEACVCVLIDGKPIDGFPRNFKVFKPPLILDPKLASATKVETCLVGEPCSFNIFPAIPDGYSIDEIDLKRINVRIINSQGRVEYVNLQSDREKAIVATFTGTCAGNSKIDVQIDGVSIPEFPYNFVMVKPPPKVDQMKSSVVGLAENEFEDFNFGEQGGDLEGRDKRIQRKKGDTSRRKGKKCDFTIIPRNSDGDIVSEVDLGRVEVVLIRPDGERDYVKLNKDGDMIAATWTPLDEGIFTAEVYIDGNKIQDRTYEISVSPPPPDLLTSSVHGIQDCTVHVPHSLSIYPCTSDGNLVSDIDLGRISVVVQNSKGGIERVELLKQGDGGISASFIPLEVGNSEVNVQIDGVSVKGCPRWFNVRPAPVDVTSSTVSGLGACQVGTPQTLGIHPRSAEGVPLSVDPKRVTVAVKNSSGAFEEVQSERRVDGDISVHFTPSAVGDAEIDIRIDGVPLNGFPCGFEVQGAQGKCSPEHSVVLGPGVGDTITRNVPTWFRIEPRDEADNKVSLDDPSRLKITLSYPNGLESPLSWEAQEDGTFLCQYTTNQTGPHVVDVEISGMGVKGNPFSVYASPGVEVSGSSSSSSSASEKKRGYLNKQGGVRKNWKRRYFELDDSNLHYYESNGGAILGSIPLEGISKVREVNNLKNHRYAFSVEQAKDSRVFLFEASSEEERNDWIECLKKASKKEDTKEGGQFDLTGYDRSLEDFFKQLYFEIIYPKSHLVVNELFRIRINVSSVISKDVVTDHRGKLEVLINMPNGQTAEIEPMRGSTPGTWVAMFTPTMEGRHACNVRFLRKYIQARTAILNVSKTKKTFGFL